MLHHLFARITQWWNPQQSVQPGAAAQDAPPDEPSAPTAAAKVPEATARRTLAVYEEALLERSRTQWQFGDWRTLAQLDLHAMEHHPDRARLALFCAAGHAQCGNTSAMRDWVRQAQEWGCPRKLVAQMLISGVQNSLGRASAIASQPDRAKLHFERSVRTGMPHCDTALLARARCLQQGGEVGMPLGMLEKAKRDGVV